MNAFPLRDAVIARLQQLSDEQITHVLAFIQVIQGQPYDQEKDPLLTGELLFSGQPDLGDRAEDILNLELGIPSGTGDTPE
jgi:hypothetical protein